MDRDQKRTKKQETIRIKVKAKGININLVLGYGGAGLSALGLLLLLLRKIRKAESKRAKGEKGYLDWEEMIDLSEKCCKACKNLLQDSDWEEYKTKLRGLNEELEMKKSAVESSNAESRKQKGYHIKQTLQTVLNELSVLRGMQGQDQTTITAKISEIERRLAEL